MSYPIKADLIPLVRGVLISLRPFAKVHGTTLQFRSSFKNWHTIYEPDILSAQLFNVLIKIIGSERLCNLIIIHLSKKDRNSLDLILENIAIDHRRVETLQSQITPVIITCDKAKGLLTLSLPLIVTMQRPEYNESKQSNIIKPWYDEIRKRLTNHFKSIENLENAAASRSESEARYLRIINALIQENMHRETFHVDELSQMLNISRTQLFRKMKPLVQMSPGRYIRFVRLESARAILQKGHHNVTEAAFAVGFVNVSHFSRSFYKQFGFTPSQLQSRSL